MSQSFSAAAVGAPQHEMASMRHLWWLFFFLGLVSVIVGMVAIIHSFAATVISVVVFGVLLLITGITEVIHAIMVRNLKGFALHLLAAALYSLLGLFMLEDPIRAAAVFTLLIAAGFFVGGALRVIFSIVMRFPSWPWVLLQGLVDLVLGFIILSGWPESSLWVIGLFVGIDLLFHGWSWVILGLGLRTYSPAPSV
jgi:uncharacterized membrane protein HdeD (DUF308 family)